MEPSDRRPPVSIRRRLLAALLALLALAGGLAAALGYLATRAEIDALLDEELRQVALSVRELARLDTERIERSAQRPAQRLQVQIDDARSGRQYRSRDVAALPPAAAEGFRELAHAGETWRVYALRHDVQTVQVAQPLSLRRERALQATLRIVAPLMLLVPLTALLLWWIVGRALAPLAALGAQLQARRPEALTSSPLASSPLARLPLTPLPLAGVPAEARALVAALNELLQRLEAAFEQQRRLTADAAHALRTPLTAVALQAQLAQRAADEGQRAAALERLLAGVRRASHLTAQLLALARLAPEAAQAPGEPLDLAALAAEVLEEVRPIAADRAIALEAELPPAAPYRGRSEALRLALTNALDNALRYTPSGGRVRLRLAPAEGGWCLEVSDNGPGLAADERERAFGRFYRSPQASAPGSGLGLAIVREVAQLHGGSASLHDGLDGRGLALRWLLRS